MKEKDIIVQKIPQHFFNIYHRSITLEKNEKTNEWQEGASPGHYYIGLETEGVEAIFGKNPKSEDLKKQIYGESEILTIDEEWLHKRIQKFSVEKNKDFITVKKIVLTDDQFKNAFEYALSKKTGEDQEGNFIIGVSDCTDFVQDVYHAAKLPLYFTSVYSSEELTNMDTWASKKVLLKYGSSDKYTKGFFNDITAVSKEALAASLNIDVSKITIVDPSIGSALGEASVIILPRFNVSVNDVQLPIHNKPVIKEISNETLLLIQSMNQMIIISSEKLAQQEQNSLIKKEEIDKKILLGIQKTAENTKKLVSFLEARILSFKDSFLLLIDKYKGALNEKAKSLVQEENDLQKKSQSEYDQKIKLLQKESQSNFDNIMKQKQSEFDTKSTIISKQIQSEVDAMVNQKRSEADSEWNARKNYQKPSMDHSYTIDNNDIIANKNSEIENFRSKKQSEANNKINQLKSQIDSEIESSKGNKNSELQAGLVQIQKSLEIKLKEKIALDKSFLEKKEALIQPKVDSFNKKVEDFKTDNALHQKLLSAFEHNENVDIIMDQEIDVFLQGVNSDFVL